MDQLKRKRGTRVSFCCCYCCCVVVVVVVVGVGVCCCCYRNGTCSALCTFLFGFSRMTHARRRSLCSSELYALSLNRLFLASQSQQLETNTSFTVWYR
jgi:hypothetical protein